MTEPTSLSAGAEQMQEKETVAVHLMRNEKEVDIPCDEANAATARKELSTLEIRQDCVYSSAGRPEKEDRLKSLVMDQDVSRQCELYLPVSGNCSAVESSEDR